MAWLKDKLSRDRFDYLLDRITFFNCSGTLSREILDLGDWPIGKDEMITSFFLMFTIPNLDEQPIIKNCMYIYCNKGTKI